MLDARINVLLALSVGERAFRGDVARREVSGMFAIPIVAMGAVDAPLTKQELLGSVSRSILLIALGNKDFPFRMPTTDRMFDRERFF